MSGKILKVQTTKGSFIFESPLII